MNVPTARKIAAKKMPTLQAVSLIIEKMLI
jgi:hypothetical protein